MKIRPSLWTFFAVLALFLAACGTAAQTGDATQSQASATASSPDVTSTPRPTTPPTATPEPEKVILVAPQGSDPALAQSAAALLGQLASAEGMLFEEMPSLASAPSGTRVVVYLNPDLQIKNLAGNTPEVQFVAIGTLDLRPLEANLSQIILQPQAAAFLSGYVAALTAPDWRVGGLLPDAPALLEQSFTNGVRYHCGRCAPQYAPIVLFPVTKILPGGSDAAAGWNAFKELDANLLEVVYIDSALASPDLLAQLAAEGIGLIGSGLPGEELRAQWIASVRMDSLSALQGLWPDLLQGKGGAALNAPLVIEDVNEDWLSEGRLRLIQQAADDLENNRLLPVVP